MASREYSRRSPGANDHGRTPGLPRARRRSGSSRLSARLNFPARLGEHLASREHFSTIELPSSLRNRGSQLLLLKLANLVLAVEKAKPLADNLTRGAVATG